MSAFLFLRRRLLFTDAGLAIEGFTESLSKELPLEWNIKASAKRMLTPPLLITCLKLDLHPATRGIRHQRCHRYPSAPGPPRLY